MRCVCVCHVRRNWGRRGCAAELVFVPGRQAASGERCSTQLRTIFGLLDVVRYCLWCPSLFAALTAAVFTTCLCLCDFTHIVSSSTYSSKYVRSAPMRRGREIPKTCSAPSVCTKVTPHSTFPRTAAKKIIFRMYCSTQYYLPFVCSRHRPPLSHYHYCCIWYTAQRCARSRRTAEPSQISDGGHEEPITPIPMREANKARRLLT